MRTGIRRRKAERVNTAPALRDRVQRQLAAAANAEPSAHVDPLYSVAETFKQSFRRIGSERAQTEEEKSEEQAEAEKRSGNQELSPEQERQEGQQQEEKRASKPQKPGTPPQREERINANPMQKFSKMAFERGELSAAVMQGTGKLALISCLKRASGKGERSATLFGLGAQTRNVPERDPDKVMFHRDFATSAVGLVVDVLRDARRTVDSLADMATGAEGFRAQDGGVTLRTMYPFLDDSRERALLAERQERLKGDCTPEERAILENAAVRAQALITKKASMKEEFIQKLREVSDRATEALAELEAPETLEEIAEALLEGETPPPNEETPPAPDTEGDESASVVFGEPDAQTEDTVSFAEGGESASVVFDAGGAQTEDTVSFAEGGENASVVFGGME